jgi:hypothetical protein
MDTLTTAQLTAIKNEIVSDPVLNAYPMNSDGNFAIAAALNAPAIPDFIVWRTAVTVDEIMNNGFIWTAVDVLTTGKARIWEWMTKLGSINPSKANVRQGLVDAFGSGSAMASAIVPYLKRLASRVEKLLAVGTGTTASPATMTFEGPLSYQDVEQAREI